MGVPCRERFPEKNKTMPLKTHQLIKENLSPDSKHIGECLGYYCMLHFSGMVRARAQIAYKSCCAAVAIEPHGDYDKLLTFRACVVYGNSREFLGLDPDYLAKLYQCGQGTFSKSEDEHHAEQVAILIAKYKAEETKIGFFRDRDDECHIFVELSPCQKCSSWLNRRPETWNAHYIYEYETTSQDEFGAEKREQEQSLLGYGPALYSHAQEVYQRIHARTFSTQEPQRTRRRSGPRLRHDQQPNPCCSRCTIL